MRKKRRFPTAAASRLALRRATVLVTVVLLALALALGLRWAFNTTAAAPTGAGSLTCSVKASCDAEEVAVFRMSFTANAHAGTPAGSAYGYSVCCGGVTGLGSDCSGNYDTVLALSDTDNAHAATTAGGAYTTEVCLSVATGTVSCTYGPDCGTSACLATISGDTNAHVADCDGTDDYATKVCCEASAQDCSSGVDTDGDGFDNDVECYLPTDPGDDCTNDPGVHDAWPLDVNMDTFVTVVGDVLPYSGRMGATGGPPPSGNWRQRLDLNMDNFLTVVGDVLKFSGKIGQSCT
jgi:hypothetical protein